MNWRCVKCCGELSTARVCLKCGADNNAILEPPAPPLREVSHPYDPKDTGTKVPGFTYAWMIPYLTRVFRRHGYACAVHGSMSRDLDIVAVPWVEEVSSPEVLIEAVCKMTDGHLEAVDEKSFKPHGRRAFTITFNGAWHFIDISVMPTTVAAAPEANPAEHFEEILTGNKGTIL